MSKRITRLIVGKEETIKAFKRQRINQGETVTEIHREVIGENRFKVILKITKP